MSCKPNNLLLPASQRPKLKARKKDHSKDRCQVTNERIHKGNKKAKQEERGSSAEAMPEESSSRNTHSERTIEIDADATQSVRGTSNHCLASMAYNDDGDELDRDGNIQWVLAAKKSLLDGNYMVDPIRLGLPKTIRVMSLVMRFIDILRKKKCKFDVTDANPNALLTYMDRDFIGLRNKGVDTAHTSNWSKTASSAKRKADVTEAR